MRTGVCVCMFVRQYIYIYIEPRRIPPQPFFRSGCQTSCSDLRMTR